jgi:hypothetical protein
MDYNDITEGLRVTTMLPLDAKSFFPNLTSLTNLGPNSNLAFTYFEGMIAYAAAEGKSYRWRTPKENEIGLLTVNFQYPAGIVIGGVNYANRLFNFFEITYGKKPIPFLKLELKAKGESNELETLQIGDAVEGFKDANVYWDTAVYLGGNINDRDNYLPLVETLLGGIAGEFPDAPEGEAGSGLSAYELAVINGYEGTVEQWLLSLKGANGTNGANGDSAYQVAIANGYVGTQAAWLISLKGINGANGLNGISAYQVALNNGYVGTQDAWLLSLKGLNGANGTSASNNLQRDAEASFPLTDADNNYVIQLKNTADITITVPAIGLRLKFNCGFVRKGTGEVSFVEASGVTIENPVGKRISRRHDPAYIERDGTTQVYTLFGNTKV